jgi:Flp pilus assembly protein TadD
MTFDSVRHWVAFKRGSMLLRKARWRQAASLLTHATTLAPEHWESHNNLAIAFLKLGRWEEAAGMAQRAIRLNPTAGDSHAFFGIALLQLERWDEAVVACL